MTTRLLPALAFIGGWVATATIFLSLHALADDNSDDVPRLIAYEGTLDKDGEPITGTLTMSFALYGGATAAAADHLWSETQEVSVNVGRFSVLLGSTSGGSEAALAAVVQNADDLYLGVTVDPGDAAVSLVNRKRFVPLPYAAWTATGTDLNIQNKLILHSSQIIDDAANGDLAPLVVEDGDGRRLVVDGDDIASDSTLMINGTSGAGATFDTPSVQVAGDVVIDTTAGGVALRQSSGELAVNPLGDFDDTYVLGGLHAAGAWAGLDVTIEATSTETETADIDPWEDEFEVICSDRAVMTRFQRSIGTGGIGLKIWCTTYEIRFQ